jgi:hypothetical protein
MERRRLLLGLLALPIGAAGAQEAADVPSPAPAPAPARPRPPRRRTPRRLEAAVEPIRPLGPPEAPPQARPRLDAAPVPNRDIEAPRTVHRDEPEFGPTVMNRRLPSRGQAAEGSYSSREDRLFTPGPGARLSVPFSY